MENGKRIEFNGVVKIVILAIVMLTITGITAIGIAAGAKETVVAFEDQGYTVKITFPDGEGIEHTGSKEFVLRDRCDAEDVNLIDVRGRNTSKVISISIEIEEDSDIQWSLFHWMNSHNYPLYMPVDKDTRTNVRVLPITVRPIASDLPHRFYTRIYKITVREVEKEYQPQLDIYFTLVLAGKTIPEIKQTNKPPVAHASVVSDSRPELEPGSHITVEYGETVILSAAESYDLDGEIDLYTWRRNDTLMALGEVTQHRYLPIGKNVVTLEVQDNKGAKSTDTVVVTITEKTKGKLMLRVRRPFRSTYDIGDEVGIVFDVTNVGTVDVECRTSYFVIDPFGDLVSEINSGLPNIAAGKEYQWAPLKWQIPSTAKTGEYTIEAFLVWSSGFTDAVASFTVTETAVKEAVKPPAVSTMSIEKTIGEGPTREYPPSNAERNSNSRAREGINLIAIQTARLKDVGATDIHIAKFVNREVGDRIAARNNFWKNPLTTTVHQIADYTNYIDTDFGKWRDSALMAYDTTAIWAWNNRVGQCEEFGCTVYYILKTAGIQCEICSGTNNDHQFVVMNVDKAMIDEKTGYLKDSRKWPENALVIDAWQGKVLTGDEAYKNKHVMDEGKVRIVVQTSGFTPRNNDGPTDINDRNLVWDTKNKLWKCRDGYERAYYAGAPLDYCRRIQE